MLLVIWAWQYVGINSSFSGGKIDTSQVFVITGVEIFPFLSLSIRDRK